MSPSAVGGGRAKLWLADRGDGQRIAIRIRVIGEHIDRDCRTLRGGHCVRHRIGRLVAGVRCVVVKDWALQRKRTQHRDRLAGDAPERFAIFAGQLAAIALTDGAGEPKLPLDRLPAEGCRNPFGGQRQVCAVKAAVDIGADL